MIDQASRLRALVAGERTAANDLPAPSGTAAAACARVMAVTSGKGGVGKTTVAVNLALLLAERGRRTLIVDADLGLANVDVMLGIDPPRHIGHLLLPAFAPEDVAEEGPFGLRIISGGSGLRELAEAGHEQRRQLGHRLIDYYDRFEYVVVDTSPGIDDATLDFLSGAERVLLVTTREPTSLRDTYAAAKAICARVPAASITLVVNQSSSDRDAAEAVKVIDDVALRFLNRRCDDWSWIEHDPTVGRAVRARRALALMYPRSPATLSLRRLAASLDD